MVDPKYRMQVQCTHPGSDVFRDFFLTMFSEMVGPDYQKASAACKCCRGAGCPRIRYLIPLLEEGIGVVGPRISLLHMSDQHY